MKPTAQSLLGAILLLLVSLSVACEPKFRETSYDPKGATETQDREIQYQVRKVFRQEGGKVSFSNEFAGARLHEVHDVEAGVYRAVILPENTPINKSPWYAFQVWGDAPQSIEIELSYPEFSHRYHPKISMDGQTWVPLSPEKMQLDTTSGSLRFQLDIDTMPRWVAGQELFPSDSVYAWEARLARQHGGERQRIGYSRLGKPLFANRFGHLASDSWIVVMGRQHPPEYTGYLASQAFVEAILDDSPLAQAFRQRYCLTLVTMLNPDGIDQGHWRQSAGGVDLNRDWANFHQPEPRAMRDYLLTAQQSGVKVPFAIDFHSTDSDMFYVFTEEMETHLPGFTGKWLDKIQSYLPDYQPDTEVTDMKSPSAKYFFFQSLKTEFVTYEVGDETDRAVVVNRAAVAARAMMELLLEGSATKD